MGLTIFMGLLALLGIFDGTADAQRYSSGGKKFHRPGESTTIFTPGDYNYGRAWYTVEDRSSFVFSVQTCGSVYLALSDQPSVSEEFTVEIALGIEDNTHSGIRFAFGLGWIFRTPSKDILHCNDYRQFWVRWSGLWIEVGHGPLLGDQTFMSYSDVSLAQNIIAVGLASGMGASALWQVPENSGHFLIASTPEHHRYDSVWKSVKDRFFYNFNLRACGDGHVVLAAEKGVTSENVLEFVLGGWQNNRTVIRSQVLGGFRAGTDTPRILSCTETREFWISWLDGIYAIGRGGQYGKNLILNWTDPNPISVRYLSISTGFSNPGRWLLFENQESVSHVYTKPVETGDGINKYKTFWMESPSKMYTVFAVKTCTDASILLSEYDGVDTEFDIEVVIGSDNNTKTVVRYVVDVGVLTEVVRPNTLRCDDVQAFWIDWTNGTIRVGVGVQPGRSQYLEQRVLPPNSQFQFKAYSVATPAVKGEWRFRENIGDRLALRTPNFYNHYDFVWRSIPHKKYFTFRLKACNDGHVALSPTPGVVPKETYIDVIFGGWGNTRTVISRVTGPDSDRDRDFLSPWAETQNLFRCGRGHLDLWVSWRDDVIEVGRGSLIGHHVFTRAPLEGVLPIQYVGLSTGWGSTGDWLIEEDNGDFITYYTTNNLWIAVDFRITWARFKVRSCKDAIIKISAIMDDVAGTELYEIGLGTEDNQKSYIKLQYDLKVTVDTPDLLHCVDNEVFWIGWKDGLVKVGRGYINELRTFMEWQDPRPFDVLALSFSIPDVNGRYHIEEATGYYTVFTTPTDYQYHTIWRTTEHAQGTIFGVTACSDVHLILSESTRQLDNMYEIFIGGHTNTRSVIRTYGRGDHVGVQTNNILNCAELRHFWISWANSGIEVGRGEIIGQQRFMDYLPLTMYEVGAIGYSTGYGFNGTWNVKLWDGLIPIGPPVTPGPEVTTRPPLGGAQGLGAGQIAGVVIGAVVGAVLIALIVVAMVFLRQGKDLPLLPAEHVPAGADSGSTSTADTNANAGDSNA